MNNDAQPENDLKVFQGADYPCPLCNIKRKIGISKKDKPYLVCNYCGMQLFVRGEKGIQKLKKIINDMAAKKN